MMTVLEYMGNGVLDSFLRVSVCTLALAHWSACFAGAT